MEKNSPLDAYKQTGIKTADRGQLVVIVYENIIKNLKIGKNELDNKKPKLDIVNNSLNKAHDFLTELMTSLNFEEGGDIAKNLFSLYDFLSREIMRANFKKDPSVLVDVIDMFSTLHSAWIEVAVNFKSDIRNQKTPTHGIELDG